MAPSPESLVIVRVEDRGASGRVAHVLVNNPEKRNALGQRGKEELVAAFEALAGDPELRVAVLTGAGDRSFIGGADLAEMAATRPGRGRGGQHQDPPGLRRDPTACPCPSSPG